MKTAENTNEYPLRFIRIVVLIAAVTFCLALSGCGMFGYSDDSLFPRDVATVRLEMFENQTFRRGTEYELSDALAKRIEADTPYKIVTSDHRADTVISGRITNISESGLSVERELGGILEREVEVQAVVNWKNLKTGQYLVENKTVKAAASYTSYQNQDFKYASALAANKLAEKIIELMETEW
ncbi:MAG: LptE family protein [Sedimentisphaerales bacterium]|nr:LptE family protein [Sedimentisphaerales bacterium]